MNKLIYIEELDKLDSVLINTFKKSCVDAMKPLLYEKMHVEILTTIKSIRELVTQYSSFIEFETIKSFYDTYIFFIKQYSCNIKNLLNNEAELYIYKNIYKKIIDDRYFSNSVKINIFSQKLGYSDISYYYFFDKLNDKIYSIYDELNINKEGFTVKTFAINVPNVDEIIQFYVNEIQEINNRKEEYINNMKQNKKPEVEIEIEIESESEPETSNKKQGSQIKEFKTTFNGKTQIMKVPNKFNEEETYNIISQLVDDNPELSKITMNGYNLDLQYLQQQILLAKDRWYGLGYSLGDLYFHGWDAEHSNKMYAMHKEIDKRLKELYALTVIGLDDDMKELWSKGRHKEKTDDERLEVFNTMGIYTADEIEKMKEYLKPKPSIVRETNKIKTKS